MTVVTKESLEKWVAELESQPHLSLKEERYLAVMKELAEAREELIDMVVAYENLMAGGAP